MQIRVTPQKVLLAGAALGAAACVLAVVGALLGWWWLVALVTTALLTAVLLVALDAHNRVRALRATLRTELDAQRGAGRAAPTTDDVVGTVRALQAQYTGRLDRLQDSVDAALRRLEDRG
ncbi:hypothetical protein [Ornithinimicrobium tianjinense]|uniref:Uncharacterized protein n=1 Tax=Ornithinimicrobium tianjinense TaxID=1195761 RepID=A0A917BND1_9MICO|nr:hypothetical protein [Ornithinimicrobium tianjinense]GGF52843.1 hypothetical protein GCM10011366_20820 [Ornithinimicrobium tianjinense]